MRIAARVLVLMALIVPTFSQSAIEQSVLKSVQEMMEESGGRVTFSTLHNDPRFDSDQKAFLGRLYEIFFQIPAFLQREFESTGKVPTRSHIGSSFRIGASSVELLLRVMESDSRVPPLFTRSQSTREISGLKLENIKAFVQSQGTQVRITEWEGQKVPAFKLEKIGDGSLASSQIAGKPALLYFWFTGCPPCVRIAPILSQLDKEFRSKGFEIIGLNADWLLEIETTEAQHKAYLEKNGIEYVNLHLDEATRSSFGNINVFPTLFFVAKDGTVAKHLLNFQDRMTLEGIIQDMVK